MSWDNKGMFDEFVEGYSNIGGQLFQQFGVKVENNFEMEDGRFCVKYGSLEGYGDTLGDALISLREHADVIKTMVDRSLGWLAENRIA